MCSVQMTGGLLLLLLLLFSFLCVCFFDFLALGMAGTKGKLRCQRGQRRYDQVPDRERHDKLTLGRSAEVPERGKRYDQSTCQTGQEGFINRGARHCQRRRSTSVPHMAKRDGQLWCHIWPKETVNFGATYGQRRRSTLVPHMAKGDGQLWCHTWPEKTVN